MPLNYLDAVDRCYAALEQENGFDSFARSLGAKLGAAAGDIVAEDSATNEVCTFGSFGFDPAYRESYDSDFAGANPWVERLQRCSGNCVHSDFEEQNGFCDSAYYNEWVQPQGLDRSVGARLTPFPDRTVWVGFVRAKGERSFSNAETDTLARILPHLNRALALSARISPKSSAFSVKAIGALLEAAAIVSPDGRIIEMNEKADILVDGRRIAKTQDKRLVLKMHGDNTRFRQALKTVTSVMEYGAPQSDPSGEVCLAHDCNGGVTVLRLMPFCTTDRYLGTVRRNALVLMRDWHARPPEIDVRALSLEYDLTPTESDLVAHLAVGGQLDAFSQTRGMALSTARWHLKNAEAKTGTRRAEQLVALAHAAGLHCWNFAPEG